MCIPSAPPSDQQLWGDSVGTSLSTWIGAIVSMNTDGVGTVLGTTAPVAALEERLVGWEPRGVPLRGVPLLLGPLLLQAWMLVTIEDRRLLIQRARPAWHCSVTGTGMGRGA